MRSTLIPALSMFAIAVAAPVALAQHEGDVGLTVVNNRITTNLIDNSVFTPERVFGAEFGELFPNFTDEPGFDTLPGTFVPGSMIGFNVLRALREWDGSSFSTIPSVQIEIGFGPITPVLTPLTDVLTPGFSLAVGSNGQWHRHLEYTLLPPATDGIYLMEMELFTSQSGIATSENFWFVFNQNRPEFEHDAAIDWARDNLVPAPGPVGLLAASGLFAIRRRRTA